MMAFSPHPAAQHQLHDPVKLIPKQPLRRVQIARRQVLNHEKELEIMRVLEPAPGCSSSTAYAIGSALSGHSKPGVALLLSTPVIRTSSTPAGAPSSQAYVVNGERDSVIIKVVPKPPKISRRAVLDNPYSEVAAHQLLTSNSNCPTRQQTSQHVIPLLDAGQDTKHVFLILPYSSHGDMFTFMEARGGKGLPEPEALDYLSQMTLGLLAMKEQNLAHHDVSLENTLIVSQLGLKMHLQIIDLGMTVQVPQLKAEDNRIFLTPQRCCGKPGYVVSDLTTNALPLQSSSCPAGYSKRHI